MWERRAAVLAITASVLLVVTAWTAHAATTTFSGVGGTNTAGGAFNALSAFKAAIGGADNGGGPPQTTGFRTITWDGVGLGANDGIFFNTVITPNHTVGIPTIRFQARGLLLEEIYAVSDTGFTTENPGLQPPPQLPAFSPTKIVSAFNENTIELSFVVPSDPGSPPFAARVRGFGAIFLDVEKANISSIEFFNGATSLGRFFVPPAPSTQPSFLGVLFDAPVVTNVILTVGEGLLFSFVGTTVTPGPPDMSIAGAIDQAAADDFVFSEPVLIPGVPVQGVPTLGTSMMILLGGLLFAIGALRLRRARRSTAPPV
jgi:hypothetical protein